MRGPSPSQSHPPPPHIATKKLILRKTYLERLETECTAEVRMGILGVSIDDRGEVLHGLFMVVYHLVGLCALVQEADIVGVTLDAATVGPYGLLELLNAAVSKPNVVVDISLNIRKGFVFERFLQLFNALLVLLVRVVSQTKFVENLSVVGVLL